jgi:sensor histidine kinase YesM
VYSNPKDVLKFEKFIFGRANLVYNNESVFKNKWPATYERKIKTDYFYGAERQYVYQYLPGEGKFKWIIDQRQNNDHIWDIFRSSDGQVWLATVEGVKILKNTTLVPVMPELNHTNTISIDQLSTGQMVVGTKGKGVFVYDEGECNMINITTTIGLSTDLVEYLWVDDNDDIWVATLKGLNKIYRTSSAGFSVRQFHQRHGLPSEDIYMVRTYGKDIWLATSKGLAVFSEPPADYMTFIPEISHMYINDKKKQAQEVKSLTYEENSIRIELYNLDYTQSNQVKYRYRMQNRDEWTQEPSNTLNFINLTSGNYRLEIQAANKDGFWSKSLVLPFTILRPWWLSWYFIIFSISVIGLWIFLFYRSRIKMIKSEQKLKNQMLTYEKQALLAQMNPHFIFNAFSAIQYYINTKATKKADDYLTDFSYLIRKILDNSGKKDILLSEEIKLLTLYTQLEARRFDNKFIVNIFVDDEIDTDVTRIPCMLIQPLVENAINHGLMHLTDRKGQLQINFMDYNGSLRIVIEDNGVGMEKSKGTSLHKMFDSYGLKLLDDRITSYRNSGEYYITLTNEDLYEGSIPAGTKFTMDIAQGKN